MIVKAIKSISVGVLIQLGLGLGVQGMAQAYCAGHKWDNSSSCQQRHQEYQDRQIERLEQERKWNEIQRGFSY